MEPQVNESFLGKRRKDHKMVPKCARAWPDFPRTKQYLANLSKKDFNLKRGS